MAVAAWMYIVFWITVSCTMILFNKAVLDQLKFPYPMFLTTWHMVLATVLTQIMSKTTNMLPGVKEMLKAFTPVAVLIFSFFAGLEKTSYMELYIVMIICVGVALTSVGESYFSWIGFTFQSLAIMAESSRLVLVNVLMKQLKLDPLSSLYYIAPVCALFIGVACLYFEGAELPLERMQTSEFILTMIVNGAVAFTLNVAVVLLISNTSALVMTLAGIIKDILLVFLSITVFGSPVTPLQYAGYAVALLGLNLHKEYKKSPEKIGQLIAYMMSCGTASASK